MLALLGRHQDTQLPWGKDSSCSDTFISLTRGDLIDPPTNGQKNDNCMSVISRGLKRLSTSSSKKVVSFAYGNFKLTCPWHADGWSVGAWQNILVFNGKRIPNNNTYSLSMRPFAKNIPYNYIIRMSATGRSTLHTQTILDILSLR